MPRKILALAIFIYIIAISALILIKPKSASLAPIPIQSIVRLHSIDTKNFFCSGTVISDHRVLTAAHCVAQSERIVLVMTANSELISLAQVESYNERADVAILYGDFGAIAPVAIETDPAKIIEQSQSDELWACGYPWGGQLYCSKYTKVRTWVFYLHGLGALWPGMSGGPCFNARTGQIIGVNSAMDEQGAIIAPIVNLFDLLD